MHTQLDDPSDHGAPLEELAGTADEKDGEYAQRLHAFDPTTADPRRALILKISHIGGHKFAGNVIVRFLFFGGLVGLKLTDVCRSTSRRVCPCGTAE